MRRQAVVQRHSLSEGAHLDDGDAAGQARVALVQRFLLVRLLRLLQQVLICVTRALKDFMQSFWS